MTMITPSYLGETIEYSSLHACRSTLEDPTWIPNPTALCKSVPCSLQDESLAVSSSGTRLILHRQREGDLGAAELAGGDAFLLDAEYTQAWRADS